GGERMRLIAALTAAGMLGGIAGATAQESPGDVLEARIWLSAPGDEPVVQRGDRLGAFFRTSEDAFVAILRIDTDGRVELLFPTAPGESSCVEGARDHRLGFPGTPFWRVSDDPGMGYLCMVASPAPLDFSAFGWDERFGWDLSTVATRVYEDPYVAIDDFVAAMIPDWDVVPYALDFLTYHVGETRAYPRFLCYDCHTYRSYAAWNPYSVTCSTYQVVIYDDPYFYPTYRYAGPRVVYPRPIRDRPRYAVAVRSSGSWAPIVRVREAPPRSAEFKETPAAGRPAAPVRRGAAATS